MTAADRVRAILAAGAVVGALAARAGAEPAAARVARIYPAGFTKVSSLGVEQQRVKVILTFDVDVLDRLRAQRNLGADYRVRVRVYTAEKENALVVPRSAMFRAADGGWRVFVAKGARARVQPIQVGLTNDESAEVVEGLTEGDVVILAPETNLADGDRVRLPKAGG